MIAAKALVKRHWPRLRLRTILLTTLVLVAALPGVGAVFLRVYENTLVRQTESELVAQGAALVAAAELAWPRGDPVPSARPLRAEDYRPEPPRIDLNSTPILPERPQPIAMAEGASSEAQALAGRLLPLVLRTSRTTLASIRIIDPAGRILNGRGAGGSYANVAEVRQALGGNVQTVLRHNAAYHPRYPLEWLSRASDLRIHHVRPIVIDGRVAGALLLSRSPRALFRGIYEDRGKIMIGVVAIFGTLVLLSGLLSRGIARPIEQLSAATRDLVAGHSRLPEPPPTAAIEIQALYRDFARMAKAVEHRSRYLRDFAHAVSHEFKTPLAAIRGGIELLEDHHATMDEADRRRFLGNISADATRLAQLVSRLLELARADMALPARDERSDIASILRRIPKARRTAGPRVMVDVPDALRGVSVPESTIDAVMTTLIDNSAQAGASTVTIRASRSENSVVVELVDDGPGIEKADRERVFEPFFTSRRSAGGTGLGLPIARSLLEASGATIELMGPAQGAGFRLTLPSQG